MTDSRPQLLASHCLGMIKKVNEDDDAIEIVSRHGNAVLVSAEDDAALREGAYLLRSPANAVGCSMPTRTP